MKIILLTCFLALPCLFQKARIKFKAIKERLGLPSPSTAPRCDVLIKYLAVGVSHVAKRSVFRAAYLQNKLVLTSPLCLTLTLLCCTSPTLSKSAQSPPEPSIHRSAVHVSPHSGDTHRGEETLSDTFTQVDYGAEVLSPANYTTSLSTLDGGPMLRTSVSRLPSLTNFGLINPDQDMGAGEGIAGSQPAPFPVLPDGQFNPGREAHSQSTEAQSLVSNVLTLASKKSSSVPVFRNQDRSGREAYSQSTEAKSLVSNVLLLESSNGLVDPDQDMGAGEGTSSFQPAPVPVFTIAHHSGPEVSCQHTEAQSLASCVLRLESKDSLVDDSTSQGQEEITSTTLESRIDTLSIGDQIPEGIEFAEVLQYDLDKLRLDDLKGKYVILEFWAPTCTASIASLPEMTKIQEQFGDQLRVVPITVFQEDRVFQLLENYPSLQSLELPLVVNSQRLLEYFPHFVIPHIIILDPEGRIVAITGMEDLTESNLRTLLSTGESNFRTKSDKKIRIGNKVKLIAETPEIKNKNIWFQSAFTGYIPDLRGSLTQDFSGMSHIRLINLPLISHFQLAYSERDLVDYFGRNRLELLGFDKEELWSDRRGMDYVDWMEEGDHVFGYELIAPMSKNPYELMREDLKRFVPHIQASIELRKRTVYALILSEKAPFPKSSYNQKSYRMLPKGVAMENYPLQGFVYHLNSSFLANSEFPIVNLTGIDYPIDLTLHANLSDVESLRSALQENGLDLKLQEQEIPVLVLKKLTNPNLLMP